jgi:hypothetical protein
MDKETPEEIALGRQFTALSVAMKEEFKRKDIDPLLALLVMASLCAEIIGENPQRPDLKLQVFFSMEEIIKSIQSKNNT